MQHDHASAAQYLVDVCAANPGEITLVPLGPLSNLGTALTLSADLATTAKRVVLMGGTVDGTGN